MKEYVPQLVILHVLAGSLALLSGLAAMTVEKGKQIHRFAGQVFFYSMLVVFLTSVTVAYLKGNSFLLMVGFFSFYLACNGYRWLYLKKLNFKQKPTWVDYLLNGAGGIAHTSLLIWGIIKLIRGETFGIVAMVFGLIGLRLVYGTVRRFIRTTASKTLWIEGHIGNMIGAYIATLTAFLVVNNDKTFGLPGIVAWLLPTAIGVPYIFYWIKKYTKPAKTSRRVRR
jgi:hypothetical protein